MKFETMARISITTEDGLALIAALECHARRMTRDLRHRERIANGLIEYGNMAMALGISAKFPERRERIKRAKELRDMIAAQIGAKEE